MSRMISNVEDEDCFLGTPAEQRRVMHSDIIELMPVASECLGQVDPDNENASVETALGSDPQCPTCDVAAGPSDQ
ncbi:hypothetical protein [Polyangium aurulentum]|uniref:hypothetical protein n=1 Tax=Polyangium aurulentum TaxID=2567896 RepID=UPI0011364458|nr:hypothetical protein [Polyangium aurulentum]UQA62782.1 hypothetical protein E8A73_020960 [Polyangium aurulentum]